MQQHVSSPPSSFSLVRQQGAPAWTAAMASKFSTRRCRSKNSSPGSPPHRVLHSICAVSTHAVALVFGGQPMPRRRSAQIDRLRVSRRRICAAPSAMPSKPVLAVNCHSSRTRVRYKTGRVNHVLAQLNSDPVQDRERMIVQVLWCHPQGAVSGRHKEGWT
ncbi:uncharacterized protein [Zea mays]|uniref:uncharacterized protein n=1 Tax=Zea mays TaxID=4577 RepID=UPI000C6C7E09|nr:uncharacterized protein LOC111589286 [Zea mays]|eukprot:XP_023155851.1 uncharacterized protein LOC111589286 [Zea mays]